MNSNRILLVEDEESILESLRVNLEIEGYEVKATPNGRDALKFFKEQRFNLIILDIMLPEVDGYQICEQIRLENTEIPILFFTAKDATQDKVFGLKKGADDYITKPFNLEEFLLRVKILVRRSTRTTNKADDINKIFKFGGNEINFSTYEAQNYKNDTISLTKKEARLLKLLIERTNEVVSREQILQFVWGYDIYPTTRTIDNFILAFRKYFEEDAKNPKYFHSIRGIGYKFAYQNTESFIAL